ncbi:DUF4238 domain-containing protein [Acidisphaera sp. L21]|jgi:hypothetical protein|uniref:DUF4238 domain-containing protein n=1 Tax=Acidisphaera sp. L21 TaxID=1641851 RepID=UPI00131D9869|nr:DUF4238 domain-containing protein [Acidisphaera sp. L21]
MADKKNQHFVPKFLMRHFSPDVEEKTIGMFNIRKGKTLDCPVGLSGQCQKPYFYGQDLVMENILSEFEGTISALFKAIIQGRRAPAYGTRAHFDLLTFIALQASRTEARSVHTNEMADKVARAMMERTAPELLAYIDRLGFRIGMESAPAYNVRMGMMLSPILIDLNIKLLASPVGTAFLLSDNPVLEFNSHFRESNSPFTHGMSSIGLQIALPINPGLCLVMYDSSVYKLGKNKEPTVAITAQDVRQLNIAFYLNALNNMYFKTEVGAAECRSIHARYAGLRLDSTVLFETSPIDGSPNQLLRFGQRHPRFCPSLPSAFTARKGVRVRQPGPRDPVWAKLVGEFSEEIDAGKRMWGDFPEFAQQRGWKFDRDGQMT